jgi:hypothetical protein
VEERVFPPHPPPTQLYFMQLLMNLPSWPASDLDARLPDLRNVLSRIADHPINRIEELLPWNLTVSLKLPMHEAA